VAQTKHEHTADVVLSDSPTWVLHERDRPVVHAAHEHLDWLEEVHRKRSNQPDGCPRIHLMSVHVSVSQRLGVSFERSVVVKIGVTEWDVGISVMTNDVLVVPDEGRRKPPSVVGSNVVDNPIARERKM